MRPMHAVLIPLLTALVAAPAGAQISATIHVGPIRIGDHPVAHRAPRYVVVDNYSSHRFGQWKKSARFWRPVTVYVLGGHYYERPYRGARPLVVYRYRDHYFRAPRDRDWNSYRERYERNEWRNDRPGRSGRVVIHRSDRNQRGLRAVPRDNEGRPDVRARRRN
jgi:hypothetical protein